MKKSLILLLIFCAALLPAADTLLALSPSETQQILNTPRGKHLLRDADRLTETPCKIKTAVAGKFSPGVSGRLYGMPLIREVSTLGYAWRLTGNAKYARRGIDALLAFCREFPAERKEIRLSQFGGRGHIMYAMALGAWLFENVMTPQEKNELARCGAGYIDLFLEEAENPKVFYYKVHNWNGLAIGPCAMFAALLPEYPGNAGRLAESLRIVKRWLDASIDEKGGFLEGPHYLSYGGDRVFLMAWILRDRGGEDLFRLPKIQKLPAMMIQKLIPGTMFMDFRNDSDYRKPDCAALMLAAGLRDPAAAWLWKHGRHNGDFPLTALFARHLPKAEINFADYPAGVFFPQRQFALWRTGWSADDMLFSIECGPFTYTPSGELNTHRHADKGHFCLYAFGDKWAIDGGYANDWSNKEDSRGLGFAHSLVSIDGLSQVQGVDFRKENTFSSDFIDNGRFGALRANMTAAYNGSFRGTRGAQVQSAVRQVLFARPSGNVPAYAVVFDRIVKDGKPHVFAWNMLFPTDKAVTLRPDGALFTARNGKPYLKTPAANRGKAVAGITLKKPGKFRLWAEMAALNPEYPQRSDSFYVRVDGAEPMRWDFDGRQEFSFFRLTDRKPALTIPSRRADIEFNIAAGEHSFEILGREPDAAIRRLFLAPIRADRKTDMFWGNDVRELKLVNQGLTETPSSEKEPNRCAVKILCDKTGLVTSKDFYMPPNQMQPELLGRFTAAVTAVNPVFAAVLLPLRPGVPEPEIESSYAADSVTITVKWGKTTDRLTFHYGPETPEFHRLPEN